MSDAVFTRDVFLSYSSKDCKRFRIAFSFAGEKRDFVSKVADILARRVGRPAIIDDKYRRAGFAHLLHAGLLSG